ncbi:MAG: CBS domain-containing protein [Rhodobacteraceae bacterium]|jgi:CBS domain-containing protein|nr:CBS domain-containing protein [Paracoccaceae bacterium]
MLVSQILRSKPDGTVYSIPPDATLAKAAEELSARRIGVLIVSRDGTSLEGILSERDIVRELGQRGPSCLSDRVADVMTRDVATCLSSDDAEAVLQRMNDGRFRHLPVVEGGVLIALISQGDVVKARLSELHMEKAALQDMIMGH